MRNLESELVFRTSRSGGKGGQNVNKVETKIELIFDVANSTLLSQNEKETIFSELKNRVTSEGILKLTSQSERSQYLNKIKAVDKFNLLIENALRKKKIRKATRPAREAKEKRLRAKKSVSVKKEFRKVNLDKEF